MAITVNLRYTGKDGSAKKFAEEMEASGTVQAIRRESGNLRYEHWVSLADPETVLLIDSWKDQAAIDAHHASAKIPPCSVLVISGRRARLTWALCRRSRDISAFSGWTSPCRAPSRPSPSCL